MKQLRCYNTSLGIGLLITETDQETP